MTSRRAPPPDGPLGRPGAHAEAPSHPQADDAWATVISLCFSVRDWWSALCEELDLTPAQGMALKSLDRPLPMSTLADALACDASNVTGIVDKLESRGLIARRGADHDRRVKMLCVTELGRSLRDRLVKRLLEPPAALAALPSDLKTRLTATLRKVIGELSDPAAVEEQRRRSLRVARG
ncbi:MAG TPA: MarR family transcriptional regulator [Polyangia bacterium]|nr:MarR family transcriptional regulator [Polyangia bacterium]